MSKNNLVDSVISLLTAEHEFVRSKNSDAFFEKAFALEDEIKSHLAPEYHHLLIKMLDNLFLASGDSYSMEIKNAFILGFQLAVELVFIDKD